MGRGLDLDPLPRFFLIVALTLLVGGALFALLVQLPLDYREVKESELGSLAGDSESWQSWGWIGTRRSGEVWVKIITAARATNRRKSWNLRAAFVAEAVGIVSLAMAATAV